MNMGKKKMILLLILPVIIMSCQCLPKENITIPSVIPVERTVLLTVETETYTDGVFLMAEEYGKVKINISRLQEEIDLLRAELSKFE